MQATFDRFTLTMTRRQAEGAAHPGNCDADVRALSAEPTIRRQLARLMPTAVHAELTGYGAWDADELADDAANLRRILWIAAGDVTHPNG